MNTDQFSNVLAHLVAIGGTVAVTMFHADPTQFGTYAGAVSVIGPLLWSFFVHKAPA